MKYSRAAPTIMYLVNAPGYLYKMQTLSKSISEVINREYQIGRNFMINQWNVADYSHFNADSFDVCC